MFDPMDLYYVEICYSLIFFAKYTLKEQTNKIKTYIQVFLINTKYFMKIIYQTMEICSFISEILTMIPILLLTFKSTYGFGNSFYGWIMEIWQSVFWETSWCIKMDWVSK